MTERVSAGKRARLEIAGQLCAVLYLRVSKPGDKSIRDQEKVGRRDCAEQGIPVVAVYSDKQSASRYRRVQERPGFIATKKCIRDGRANLLWTFASNRAARDLDDYVPLRRLCIETGTLWRYGKHTYDLSKAADRRTANADAIRAEEHGDDLSDAVKRGVDDALEDGKPHGKLPRGYRIVRDPDTGKATSREPIPAQARVIQRAAEMILDDPQARLAPVIRELAPAWKLAGGKGTWQHRTVRALLINPTYAGLRTHKGEVIRTGTWAPILTVEQHTAVRARLLDSSRRTQRGTEPVHLYSYIAICSRCKAPVSVRRPPKKKPTREPTYRCSGPASHVSRSVARVDKYVTELLMQLLERPDSVAKLIATDEHGRQSIDAEWAQIKEIRAQIKTYVRDAAKTRMSAESVALYTEPLEDEIAAAQRRIDAMTKPVDPVLADIVGPDARKRWATYTLEEKRCVIRASMVIEIRPIVVRGEIGVQTYPIGALTAR